MNDQEPLTRQIWACRNFAMCKMSAKEQRESLHLSLDHVSEVIEDETGII